MADTWEEVAQNAANGTSGLGSGAGAQAPMDQTATQAGEAALGAGGQSWQEAGQGAVSGGGRLGAYSSDNQAFDPTAWGANAQTALQNSAANGNQAAIQELARQSLNSASGGGGGASGPGANNPGMGALPTTGSSGNSAAGGGGGGGGSGGTAQQPSKFPAMVQRMVERGETVTIHGEMDGQIGSRSYIHSRNFADAILFILTNTKPHMHEPLKSDEPDRYNIAGDRQLTNLELAQLIADLMGKELKYKIQDSH